MVCWPAARANFILSPRLRESKALELHVGVLEEVSKHLAQAGKSKHLAQAGKRIEILKSSTDWKRCYRLKGIH